MGQGPCQVGMMWREKTDMLLESRFSGLRCCYYRGCLGKLASPGPIDFGMCGSLQVLLLGRTPPSHWQLNEGEVFLAEGGSKPQC